MRETRLSGSEGGGTKPIVSSYPYIGRQSRNRTRPQGKVGLCFIRFVQD
jgi:hypothetical protein